MVAGLVEAPFNLSTPGAWLVATLPEPWAVCCWAIANGGVQHATQVAWLFLEQNEIAAVADVSDWTRARMHADGLAGAVGFLTSRRRHAYVEANAVDGDVSAWAIGTVGLSNALRVGDPSGVAERLGTINMVLFSGRPLTVEAGLEALCLVAEAKAVAMVESGVLSGRSRRAASGTGTDYLAVAWPLNGPREAYAGKHTAVGSAMGRAAYELVRQGVASWLGEQQ